MKKVAILFSMITLVLAFTATTVSAQKAVPQKSSSESVDKAKCSDAQKAACTKDAGAKACCSKEEAASKSCCAKDGAARSGEKSCSKTCTPAEKAACGKHEGATEAVPVPKTK